MDSPSPLVPIAQIRARVIAQLTDAFANDIISVEELEDRLEQVYRAQTAAEADALVAGLPAPVAEEAPKKGLTARRNVASPEHVPIHDSVVSVFSSTKRSGQWAVPHQFDVRSVFADATIDLTHATLPGDLVDMNVRVVFANLRIVVPPGLRVVNRVGAFLASVTSEAALDLAPMVPGSPVIRISGFTVFGNIEIVAAGSPEID